MKKFDRDEYTFRRIRELRGEKVYFPDTDQQIMRYTRRRMREIHQREEEERSLDKAPRACYTVSTMGDRDGET